MPLRNFALPAVLVSILGAATPAFAQNTAPAAQGSVLTVGDKAPKLTVSQWAKGEPTKEFQKGQVYIVEFWATWCGPCKVSIPHISDLAKKHGKKVNVIGVSVFETEETTTNDVVAFVEGMGDKMAYNVALDDKNAMAENWMMAARQGGIPTAFIVNGDGLIAWIGHPMEMDKPLQQVIDGKWNVKDARDAALKQVQSAEKLAALGDDLDNAMMTGDNEAAVKILDQMAEASPENKGSFMGMKAELMLTFDEAGAQKLMGSLAKNELKDNAIGLNQLAWAIVDPEQKRTKPDYKLAVSIAKRACELTKFEDGMILDTYALALFKTGDKKKAIEYQEKAVALVLKDETVDAETIAEMKARLVEFRKG